MATSQYQGSNGLLYILQKLKLKFAEKVDKVDGKGLSTNDLTDELKEKIMKAGDSDFSGDYNDLTNKPNIPSKVGELANDLEFQTATQVNAGLATKVDKETGKGLSTNDYTTAEKTKLAGVAAGAEVNVQSDWNATSGDAMILNKPTIPTVPTKVSSFTNDSGYQNASQVAAAINNSTHLVKKVVETLPAVADAEDNVIYLILKTGGSGEDYYDEYMLIGDKFELLGNSKVDLTDYWNSSNLSEITNAEIDTIWNQVFTA